MDIEGNLEAFNSLKEFLGLNSSEEKALLGLLELAKEEVEKSETIVKEYLEGIRKRKLGKNPGLSSRNRGKTSK